ncbi:cytochrome c oxidase assembly protein [Nesterenkonia sp. AY15]|uniref:cytochrome c oxidase assembly protein n=1 Tax=Nesterenkonia sp. AY15 TaxID=2901139 RepID=UPI001F4D0A90|nr:cytochrome c oxidase assembly protein [Nesterenkonia sp. AY15]MCH8571529.1 cytochrome c oxidase assembly protein [Nesterenkonia sp. AY15]
MGHQEDHLGAPTGLAPADPSVWAALDVVVVLMLLTAALGHAAALWASRRRTPWPLHRSVLFYLGLGCAATGLLGPVATAAHTSFTAHMAGHLLLGMIAPLLLVFSAPVTLALRALPVHAARGLTRVLRSPGVRVLTHPVVAGVLNAGGLWLLYTTDLFQVMHFSPVAYALVHLHIFVAGYVFTASLVGVDPDPHRASMPMRSTVLILFIAAHSILAKWLYAHPPEGVAPGDAQAGAQLMYYGGDAVDISLLVLLFAGWYSTTRPRSSQGAELSPRRG